MTKVVFNALLWGVVSWLILSFLLFFGIGFYRGFSGQGAAVDLSVNIIFILRYSILIFSLAVAAGIFFYERKKYLSMIPVAPSAPKSPPVAPKPIFQPPKITEPPKLFVKPSVFAPPLPPPPPLAPPRPPMPPAPLIPPMPPVPPKVFGAEPQPFWPKPSFSPPQPKPPAPPAPPVSPPPQTPPTPPTPPARPFQPM